MLVEKKLTKYQLKLKEQLEHINDIISTLALINCVKVDNWVDYY